MPKQVQEVVIKVVVPIGDGPISQDYLKDMLDDYFDNESGCYPLWETFTIETRDASDTERKSFGWKR